MLLSICRADHRRGLATASRARSKGASPTRAGFPNRKASRKMASVGIRPGGGLSDALAFRSLLHPAPTLLARAPIGRALARQ